jgi:hypothetical protein
MTSCFTSTKVKITCSNSTTVQILTPVRFRAEEHINNKHAGKTYPNCFDWVYVAAPNLATVYRGTRAAHKAFGTDNKKGFPKDQGIEEFTSKEDAYEYIKEEVEYINDDDAITYVED